MKSLLAMLTRLRRASLHCGDRLRVFLEDLKPTTRMDGSSGHERCRNRRHGQREIEDDPGKKMIMGG
jgi:hypothetical protein